MQMILVLIAFSFVAIILGKFNWKSDVVKYTIIAVIALLQTLYILLKIYRMEFPLD